jgi:hypothetical protein
MVRSEYFPLSNSLNDLAESKKENHSTHDAKADLSSIVGASILFVLRVLREQSVYLVDLLRGKEILGDPLFKL